MNDPVVLLTRDFPLPPDHPAFGDRLDWAKENIERGREQLARVPALFSQAVPTNPLVVAWVRDLVKMAGEGNPQLRPTVTTGPSLLLVGPVGTGKTYEAYGAIRSLALSGVHLSWIFVSAPVLFEQVSPGKGDVEAVREFAETRLLGIDDLGATKGSEFREEKTFRIINARYESCLPTIITSNLPTSRLRDAVGDRITSRLSAMSTHVALRGEDRRRKRGENGQ